ncbi:MAG: PaaI family thioesterase [Solirubrobacteraceae bacterium]|nr:PaaI family thioesterase [Solirubrobacteraceae bacterium]
MSHPGKRLPYHHENCLGCGPENASGLQMEMYTASPREDETKRVRTTIVLDSRHEGAPGLAHGGIVATALDDLFGGVLVRLRIPAVTANLSVDYRAPIALGRELSLEGWCEGVEGRKVRMRGTIHDGEKLVAEATGLFIQVGVEHFTDAGGTLPDIAARRRAAEQQQG